MGKTYKDQKKFNKKDKNREEKIDVKIKYKREKKTNYIEDEEREFQERKEDIKK